LDDEGLILVKANLISSGPHLLSIDYWVIFPKG